MSKKLNPKTYWNAFSSAQKQFNLFLKFFFLELTIFDENKTFEFYEMISKNIY